MMSSSSSGENSQMVIKPEDDAASHSYEQPGPSKCDTFKTEEVHINSEPMDWSGLGENQETAIKSEVDEVLCDDEMSGSVPEYYPHEVEDPAQYNLIDGPLEFHQGYIINTQDVYPDGTAPVISVPGSSTGNLGPLQATSDSIPHRAPGLEKITKKTNRSKNAICYLCTSKLQLDNSKSLRDHLATAHPEQSHYHCEECNIYIKTKANFNFHLARHDHSSKPHECSACSFRFSSKENRLRHEYVIHKIENEWSNKHICKTCGMNFYMEGGLKLHQSEMHKDDSNETNSNETLIALPNAEMFIITEVPEEAIPTPSEALPLPSAETIATDAKNTLKCYICEPNVQLKTRIDVTKHLMEHHTTYHEYRCNVCDTIFGTKYSFNTHLAQHDLTVQQKCSVCAQKFSTQAARFHHEASVHNVNNGFKKEHICATCGMKFSFEGSLKLHNKTLHGIFSIGSKYTCSICGKKFNSDSAFQKHEKTAHQVQPPQSDFECYLCNTKTVLTSQGCLEQHFETCHEKKEIYRCSCNMFASPKICDLNQHILAHQSDPHPHRPEQTENPQNFVEQPGEKNLMQASKQLVTCYMCKPNEQFKNNELLILHMRNYHLDEATNCSECNVGFRDNLNFNIHLSRHDGRIRPVKCGFCSLRFFNINLCKAHESHSHGVENGFLRRKPSRICTDCNKDIPLAGFKLHECIGTSKSGEDESNQNEIICHKLSIDGNIYKCHTCNTVFRNGNLLRQHLETDHTTNDSNYSCEYCPVSLAKIWDFNQHIAQHLPTSHTDTIVKTEKVHINTPSKLPSNPAKSPKCYLCTPPKHLDTTILLVEHLYTTHQDKPPYRCVECSITFRDKQYFNNHLARHDPSARPFECSVCPLRFFTIKEAKQHEVQLHNVDNGLRKRKYNP